MTTLRQLAQRIRESDNRLTSHPQYCVQAPVRSADNESAGWRTIQTFFSDAAAREYISRHSYDARPLRLYVASGHDNPEWRMVRAALLALENE